MLVSFGCYIGGFDVPRLSRPSAPYLHRLCRLCSVRAGCLLSLTILVGQSLSWLPRFPQPRFDRIVYYELHVLVVSCNDCFMLFMLLCIMNAQARQGIQRQALLRTCLGRLRYVPGCIPSTDPYYLGSYLGKGVASDADGLVRMYSVVL